MHNKLTILLLVFLGFQALAQQDPLYSQYQFNQQVINPAYTGINGNTNISFISRLQWIGGFDGNSVDGNPITNTLAAQTSVVNNKVGVGLLVVQDKLGVANNFEAHLTASYKIEWEDKTFSFGLQTGMISVNYNFNELNLKDPGDPAFASGIQSDTKPNFGAGVALMSDKFFIGLSAPRLLNTEFGDGVTSNLRYKRHFYGSVAYLIDINSVLKLKPSVLVRGVEGAPISYDVNAMLLINNMFWAGTYTRDFKSVGLMFQFDYKNAYRFGYNFELPVVTGLSQFTSHEFLLSIDLGLFGEQDVFQRYF
jgi:type IX secretion system PorP/SprF family membrane protein